MEIRRSSTPSQVVISMPEGDGTPPPAPSPSSPFDSLSSMGKKLGFNLFYLFSLLIFKSFEAIVAFIQRKKKLTLDDLKTTADLCRAFTTDFIEVIPVILDGIYKEKKEVRTLLVDLAMKWKKNPKQFLDYKREDRPSRELLLGTLNHYWRTINRTKEQRDVADKVINMDFTDSGQVGDFKDSKKYKNLTKADDQLLKNPWTQFYAYVKGDQETFGGFTFNKFTSLEEDGVFTFGGFVERLIYLGDPRDLKDEECFTNWVDCALKLLNKLKSEKIVNRRKLLLDDHPALKSIIDQVITILEGTKKSDYLYKLVCKVVDQVA